MSHAKHTSVNFTGIRYSDVFYRLFLLGRTETVHPASEQSVSWVKVMDDNLVDVKVKQELLRKAVKQQSQFRLTATIGQGCDRHLVALLFASRELGMDLPKIFAEKVNFSSRYFASSDR